MDKKKELKINSNNANIAVEPKSRNKKAVIIIILLFIGFVVLISVIFIITRKDKPIEDDSGTVETEDVIGGRGILATTDNIDDIIANRDNPAQDDYYITTMNVEWTFETWDTPSKNAVVENDINNSRTVYFDVILNDANELIYSSPFMPIGTKLEGFALNKELSKGEYNATVTYHLVSDEYEEITTTSVAVRLIIVG